MSAPRDLHPSAPPRQLHTAAGAPPDTVGQQRQPCAALLRNGNPVLNRCPDAPAARARCWGRGTRSHLCRPPAFTSPILLPRRSTPDALRLRDSQSTDIQKQVKREGGESGPKGAARMAEQDGGACPMPGRPCWAPLSCTTPYAAAMPVPPGARGRDPLPVRRRAAPGRGPDPHLPVRFDACSYCLAVCTRCPGIALLCLAGSARICCALRFVIGGSTPPGCTQPLQLWPGGRHPAAAVPHPGRPARGGDGWAVHPGASCVTPAPLTLQCCLETCLQRSRGPRALVLRLSSVQAVHAALPSADPSQLVSSYR